MYRKKKKKPINPDHNLDGTIITTLSREAAYQRLNDYLKLLEYYPISLAPLVYERETSWLELLRCSPRGLKSRVDAKIWTDYNDDTIITLDIKPEYNPMVIMLTEKDWDFWRAEMDGIEAALLHDYVDTSGIDYAASRASWYSLALQGIAIGGVFLWLLILIALF